MDNIYLHCYKQESFALLSKENIHFTSTILNLTFSPQSCKIDWQKQSNVSTLHNQRIPEDPLDIIQHSTAAILGLC